MGDTSPCLLEKKDNNYYVAESLWKNDSYGVITKTYTEKSLKSNFYWQIDMDNYYLEDGNYTEFWN